MLGGFSSVNPLHPSLVYREVAPAGGGDYPAIENNIEIDYLISSILL